MSSGSSFSDSGVWSFILLSALVLGSMIVANIVKRKVRFLKNSLVPVSVLGGFLLLAVSVTVKAVTGNYLFNHEAFSAGSTRTGIETLEILTYHCLAVGFIAMTLRKPNGKGKTRTRDVINTGLTTVSSYLVQAALGLTVTIIASFFIPKIIRASGLLLAFGYGQGTGQALNFGSIYETEYGFAGGKSFGLTVAAMGFLSASIVGVVYLNKKRRRGELTIRTENAELNREPVEEDGEIPMIESIDKITVEIALIAICYAGACGIMFLLGNAVESLKSTIFGFNFLFGALMGVLMKAVIRFLRDKGIMKRDYINNFLLNRISGFAFDIMIVAGIGAIQIDLIMDYWLVLAIICVLGAAATFIYIKLVCFKLFPDYPYEQFLAMFGMLTGTASTGVILLREVDPAFETPASENLVYQNFPAIVCGFPMMLLAAYAPQSDKAAYICLGAVVAFFAFLNIILFRSVIFKKKS